MVGHCWEHRTICSSLRRGQTVKRRLTPQDAVIRALCALRAKRFMKREVRAGRSIGEYSNASSLTVTAVVSLRPNRAVTAAFLYGKRFGKTLFKTLAV
jgi:hypothetical protein